MLAIPSLAFRLRSFRISPGAPSETQLNPKQKAKLSFLFYFLAVFEMNPVGVTSCFGNFSLILTEFRLCAIISLKKGDIK